MKNEQQYYGKLCEARKTLTHNIQIAVNILTNGKF